MGRLHPAQPADTAPWHYVNIEVTTNGFNAATDCLADNRVVAQVQKDARIVADHQLAKPVRAGALRFLIHFVGDMHQPLHCADNHDRGGNEVHIAQNGTNMTANQRHLLAVRNSERSIQRAAIIPNAVVTARTVNK